NPDDLTITGYWALDMIHKIVYPDVPSLLEERCPEIYDNYLKLLRENNTELLNQMVWKRNEIGIAPKAYYSTDIYKKSREINKLQKLESNILSTWFERTGQGKWISVNEDK
nr:hypothetical protein [Lachnospiraceae bacterium]